MNKDSKIYVAGHRGLVGSAIHRKLISEGYTNIVFRTSKELDITNRKAINNFFWDEEPEYVFMAAAKAGGVGALVSNGADFIYSNLLIQTNMIHTCYKFGVKKLLFIASNCVYPKLAVEPLKEEYILAGKLEPTVEPYAISKIAGVKMCEVYRKQYGCNFITAIPVNLYGEKDNYSSERSHVMPSLLRKFKEAKGTVQMWGTGNARREFMHADDFADACLFLMLNYNESEPVNAGCGEDIKIRDLVKLISDIVGYEGSFVIDINKPDGIMSKLLDSSKINSLGWKPKIGLREGIKRVYDSL